MNISDIFTIDELSQYLKIPKGTVYKMCQERKIPSFKAGKQLRFKKESIDMWINEMEKNRLK